MRRAEVAVHEARRRRARPPRRAAPPRRRGGRPAGAAAPARACPRGSRAASSRAARASGRPVPAYSSGGVSCRARRNAPTRRRRRRVRRGRLAGLPGDDRVPDPERAVLQTTGTGTASGSVAAIRGIRRVSASSVGATSGRCGTPVDPAALDDRWCGCPSPARARPGRPTGRGPRGRAASPCRASPTRRVVEQRPDGCSSVIHSPTRPPPAGAGPARPRRSRRGTRGTSSWSSP